VRAGGGRDFQRACVFEREIPRPAGENAGLRMTSTGVGHADHQIDPPPPYVGLLDLLSTQKQTEEKAEQATVTGDQWRIMPSTFC
jgi:hypothetical protein